MASFTITGASSTAQSLTGFQNGVITSSGSLVVASGNAVTVSNAGFQSDNLTVLGTLMTSGAGASRAVDFSGVTFTMIIGQGGEVFTPRVNTTAIDLTTGSQSKITNFGTVYGDGTAIQFTASDSNSIFVLQNTGDIASGNTAVDVLAQAGSTNIFNSGSISGVTTGISVATGFSAVFATVLQNSGLIQGSVDSYAGSDGQDTIVNTGTMIGDILLNGDDDAYFGGNGNVSGSVFGGAGADRIIGGVGDDKLFGGADDDILAGRAGDDSLAGDGGIDILRGGEGDDSLSGGDGNDTLRGGTGDDVLSGGSGDDELRGGADDDVLNGGDGDDDLRGGAGDDVLSGEGDRDDIRGGTGDDILIGGAGVDKLNGGRDDDILTGNGGRDDFIFFRKAGDDRITDFKNNIDQIVLTAFGFNSADFATEIAPALSDAGGGDTFLDLGALGGQGSVLIEGLAFGDADASDFIL